MTRTAIAHLRATPVAVPRLGRLLPRTAHGETRVNRYVVLELELEDGTVGLGEVTCAPVWNGEEPAGTVYLTRELCEAIRGLDPVDWAAIARRVDRSFRNRPFLRAGIEMACLDAAGRARGRPASDWLADPVRSEIATKIVLPARDPHQVAGMAEEALAFGAKALKIKVGIELEQDLRRVTAVRELAGNTVPLCVDANEGWSVGDLADALPRLERLGVVAVEQPIRRDLLEAAAALQIGSRLDFVADESVWDESDLRLVIATGAYRVMSLYPGKSGGIRRCQKLACIALEAGLAVTFGSNLELGIGTAALAHAAAGVPQLHAAVPSDVIGPLYAEHALIRDASWVKWSGTNVPAGPGLGVELDQDAILAFRCAV